MYKHVSIEIVEEPANSHKFRYLCENKPVNSITGVKTTSQSRTSPAIRVLNYTGKAIVVVSCVTSDKPYRPHPHDLVGRDCTKGVCKISFSTDSDRPKIVYLRNVAVQCTKKIDIHKSLSDRETLRIDPFHTGFKHKDNKLLDLSSVRLCFQVLLVRDQNDKSCLVPIPPIVSDIIYDRKNSNDLVIFDISDTSSTAKGGKKIMLFCEKVVKDDIKVRFFEEDSTDMWEAWGHFKPQHVHRQTAISLLTPQYKLEEIDEPVEVYIQLVRISDNARSEALPFQYTPDLSNVDGMLKRKRCKLENIEGIHEYLTTQMEDRILPCVNWNTYDAKPCINGAAENERNSISASQNFNDYMYAPQNQQPQPPEYQQCGYQQPENRQPGYQQPGYQQPGYQQPGYQQPGYQQPGYQQPGHYLEADILNGTTTQSHSPYEIQQLHSNTWQQYELPSNSNNLYETTPGQYYNLPPAEHCSHSYPTQINILNVAGASHVSMTGHPNQQHTQLTFPDSLKHLQTEELISLNEDDLKVLLAL